MYDILTGVVRRNVFRARVVVKRNRRGRSSRYLYEAFHRTKYGRQEPLNKCMIIFNEVADIFLSGPSRHGFRQAILERLRMIGRLRVSLCL